MRVLQQKRMAAGRRRSLSGLRLVHTPARGGGGRMTPRVLVAGYYGAGNAGDEWILKGLLAEMRRRAPAMEARVLSYSPENTRHEHGVEALGWGDLEGLAEAVRWSSLVVVGGGGLWQDYWGFDPLDLLSGRPGGIAGYGTPLVLAHLLGRPSAFLGAGVGPLRESASRDAVRDLAAMAGLISVRDAASRDELIACGLPSDRMHLGADLAFLSGPDRPSAQGIAPLGAPRPVLAVALRPWTFAGDPARWEAAVAAAIGDWCARREGQIVFVPLHHSSHPLEDDQLVAERVATRVGHPARVRLLQSESTPAERRATLAAADLVLGMRYHSVLAALWAGVPCVGLAYDPKVRHLMTEAGRGDAVLSLEELDGGELAKLLVGARAHAAGKGKIEALRNRARDSLARALELEQAPAQESPPALLGGFVLSQAGYLTALEATLRRQFDLPAAYGSRSEVGVSGVEAAAGRLKSAEGELDQVRCSLNQAVLDASRAREELEHATSANDLLATRLRNADSDLAALSLSLEVERARVADASAQYAALRATVGVRLL
ncbi:MAG: hypothetical protein FJZ97_06680, partial [Chloroflexi bacterium]|nr:hypothetical protein [Chloroflexota bacterium]